MLNEDEKDTILLRSKYSRQKDYWLDRLSGNIAPTEIPNGYDKSSAPGEKTGRINIDMSHDTSFQLIRLCKGSDLSLYVFLLAVVKLLIYRYTFETDVIVISPINQDSATHLTRQLNHLVFLRNRVESHLSFKEWILRVSQSVWEAYENQDYPYDMLIDSLLSSSKSGKPPLHLISKIQCSMDNIHDLDITESIPSSFCFRFCRCKNQIKIHILFDSDKYNNSEGEQVTRHFSSLLESCMKDVNARLTDISFLTEGEKHQLTVDFNNNPGNFSKTKSIHHLICEVAKKRPDAVAIGDSDQDITYKYMVESACALAEHLQKRGIDRDRLVGISLDRSPRMVIGILATWISRGGYIPINPHSPPQRISEILNDSQASVLITESIHVHEDFIPGNDSLLFPFDKYLSCHGNHRKSGPGKQDQLKKSNFNMNSLSYVIYTSGSTGRPKGVMVEHMGMMNHIAAKVHDLQLTGDSIVAQNASSTFDISVWQFFTALTLGGKTVIFPDECVLQPINLVSNIINRRVTVLEVVPSYLMVILECLDLNFQELKSLRYLVVTGETLKQNLVKRWFEKYPGIMMVNAYGPTEASDDITHLKMKGVPEETRVPIGRPVRNLNIYIVDKHQHLCPVGAKGEIWVSGVGVGRGYLNDTGKTSDAYIKDPFKGHSDTRLYRTGDIGRWLSNGRIEFFGRLDHQVKIRGFRIELGDVEVQITRHPSINEAVVIVKQRTESGSEPYLCAFFAAQDNVNDQSLRAYLSERLPGYMVPEQLVKLSKMPVTENGKIDRKALAQMDTETDLNREIVAPRNQLEEKLCSIWAALLKKPHQDISVHDNFFTAGGNSLKATMLTTVMHKEFSVLIPLKKIFQYPSIEELSRYLKEAKKDTHESIPAVEQKEYYPLSSAQKRLFILTQLDKGSIAYNLPMVMTAKGEIDKTRLEDTFKKLLQRHENLRTSFITVKGEPFLKIHDTINFAMQTIEEFDDLEINRTIDQFIKPFDLAFAPLMRFGMIKVANNKHLLIFDKHHIITDGISMGKFIQEFMMVYEEHEIEPLKIQYKDYSEHQDLMKRKGVLKRQRDFWLKEFESGIPVVDLPTDFERPPALNFEGERLEFSINSQNTEAIKNLSATTGSTLFMVLLSIFYVLLSRLTGNKDITVGTYSSGRTHADLEDVIGFFVNTLPLRMVLDGHKSFQEFIKTVSRKTMRAFENQDFQFEDLVEGLSVKRRKNRNPLFDIIFMLQNMDMPEITIPHLTLSEYPYSNKTSKFDVTFMGMETRGEIHFQLEYNTRLFKRETVERMITYYRNILEMVIENPDTKISGINVRGQTRIREKVLARFYDDLECE